mmetsp:Transcript_4190/g.14667  ORF Transcript_4190/g.14667 Transcript_4190/m.14667 type:complete len:401 (+) Transcript_4190:497-1699(+)
MVPAPTPRQRGGRGRAVRRREGGDGGRAPNPEISGPSHPEGLRPGLGIHPLLLHRRQHRHDADHLPENPEAPQILQRLLRVPQVVVLHRALLAVLEALWAGHHVEIAEGLELEQELLPADQGEAGQGERVVEGDPIGRSGGHAGEGDLEVRRAGLRSPPGEALGGQHGVAEVKVAHRDAAGEHPAAAVQGPDRAVPPGPLVHLGVRGRWGNVVQQNGPRGAGDGRHGEVPRVASGGDLNLRNVHDGEVAQRVLDLGQRLGFKVIRPPLGLPLLLLARALGPPLGLLPLLLLAGRAQRRGGVAPQLVGRGPPLRLGAPTGEGSLLVNPENDRRHPRHPLRGPAHMRRSAAQGLARARREPLRSWSVFAVAVRDVRADWSSCVRRRRDCVVLPLQHRKRKIG